MRNFNLQVGTKVYDFNRQEWGEVIEYRGAKYSHPYKVKFSKDDDLYSQDGKHSIFDNYPSLSLTYFNSRTKEGKLTRIYPVNPL